MSKYSNLAEAIEARKAYYPLEAVHAEDDVLNAMALRFTNDSTDEPLYTMVRLALVEVRENAKRGKSTAKIIRVLRDISVKHDKAPSKEDKLDTWEPKY